MCNGGRDWYRYTFVFDSVLMLEKFWYIYHDLVHNYEEIEIWKRNNGHRWSGWYNGYTLVLHLRKGDKEQIVKDLGLKKHEKSRRGNCTFKVA